jgi:hypothetical protein
MPLTSAQLTTLRQSWIYDFFDSSSLTYGSTYNRTKRTHFFTDAQLQLFYDQVLLEEPKLLAEYIDLDGNEQAPEAKDPTSALYRLIRIKAWTLMLTHPEYVSSMKGAGISPEAAAIAMSTMEKQIEKDRLNIVNHGQRPRSVRLQRG